MTETNHHPAFEPGADQSLADDLRRRLHNVQADEKAARGEARRLARELALTRRLLRFHLGPQPPPRLRTALTAADTATVLLSEEVVYHLDTRADLGASTAVTGWAFRPARGWDARATTITLLLRHEDTVYATASRQTPRPDVAALYAGQPPGASGGAVGLEGAGFACEIRHDAVPAGTEWKIILRLECDGRACEQFTGAFLRL